MYLLYLFKFVLYSIVDLKRINKLNGHKPVNQLYNDNLRKLPNEYGDVSVMTITTENIKQKQTVCVRLGFMDIF